MIQLFTELQEKKNVRSNLSALRASLKEATEEQKAQAIEFVRGHEDWCLDFYRKRMQRRGRMQHFFWETWQYRMRCSRSGKHIPGNRNCS